MLQSGCRCRGTSNVAYWLATVDRLFLALQAVKRWWASADLLAGDVSGPGTRTINAPVAPAARLHYMLTGKELRGTASTVACFCLPAQSPVASLVYQRLLPLSAARLWPPAAV